MFRYGKEDFIQDYCNRRERLGSTLETQGLVGRVRGRMESYFVYVEDTFIC